MCSSDLELVHALEDDLALHVLHPQHALVAQHLRAVDIDDGTQKVFQQGRLEGPIGAKDEAFHVVVMRVVVRVVMVMFVIVMATTAVVVFVIMAILMAVPVLFLREKVRINIQPRIQIEAAQIQHACQRHQIGRAHV